MKEKKVIAVVGGTGAQGGGLIRAILNDKEGGFIARAITRNSNSDKAKELEKMGAEVVEADVNNKESLISAFKGAYGAFCVTFFWEHFSPEKEKQHAQNMADAVKEAGVQHVIWSTLEDTRNFISIDDSRMPTLMDIYKVPHFDAKGESNSYFENCGVPYTLMNTSFYWDNFIYFGLGPQKGPDGKLALTMPMQNKKLPGIAAEDIGKTALGIFKAGDKYKGKTLGIAGEKLTIGEIAKGFAEIMGEEVGYNDVPASVFRNFDFPGAEDLGNMFQFKAEFEKEFCDARDINETRKLNPELLTFKEWLLKNENKIKE